MLQSFARSTLLASSRRSCRHLLANTRTLATSRPVPDLKFDVKFEIDPVYDLHVKPAVEVDEDGNVKPVALDFDVPMEDPLAELQQKYPREYEDAVDKYSPMLAKFGKKFDDLKEWFPWFLENLVRNKGKFNPDASKATDRFEVDIVGFSGSEKNVENVRATLTADVGKIFEDDPEALDRFAQVVGHRLNPETMTVTIGCDVFNNSFANRDQVVTQFKQSLQVGFGEERWNEIVATIKGSPEKYGGGPIGNIDAPERVKEKVTSKFDFESKFWEEEEQRQAKLEEKAARQQAKLEAELEAIRNKAKK